MRKWVWVVLAVFLLAVLSPMDTPALLQGTTTTVQVTSLPELESAVLASQNCGGTYIMEFVAEVFSISQRLDFRNCHVILRGQGIDQTVIDGGTFPYYDGPAIIISQGTLEIHNMTILHISVQGNEFLGVPISPITTIDSNLVIESSRIAYNATNSGGGAIRFRMGTNFNLTINRSIFHNNANLPDAFWLGSGGGALIISSTGSTSGSVHIECTRFETNSSGVGGAIHQGAHTTLPTTVIAQSSFVDNYRLGGALSQANDIFTVTDGPVNAENNWWGGGAPTTYDPNAPDPFDYDVSDNVDFTPLSATDPTALYEPLLDGATLSELEAIYASSSDCAMQRPLPPTQVVDCSTIEFTNICFDGEHEALKSLIFWAIFHETSEDRFFSGQDRAVNTTLDETNARAFSSFLSAPPYCSNGMNNAQDEQLESEEWGGILVQAISHCYDHRYLAAQTIINRFLNSERRNPYDANDPATLMSLVARTMLTGFAGSLGDSTNDLWEYADTCREHQNDLPPSAVRRPTRGENIYLTIGGSDWDSNPDDDDIYFFREIIDELNRSPTTASNQLAAWRWMAVRWLDGSMACMTLLPLSMFPQSSLYMVERFQQVYPRIMGQINQAIQDMYAQVPDQSLAAFDLKVANITTPLTHIGLCVGGCTQVGPFGTYSTPITNVTQTLIENEYHMTPPQVMLCSGQADIYSYDDNASIRDHIDQVRNCYRPGYFSVYQPALFYDAPLGNPGGYQWQTIVYQQTLAMDHEPRYGENICEINVDISNCE